MYSYLQLNKNKMILPRSKDIKAARNHVGWTQEQLSKRCRLSIVSINQIENGKQEATGHVLKRICHIFYNEDIVFLEDGGFRVDKNPIKILVGEGAYLKLQDDVMETIQLSDEREVLYFGADYKNLSNAILEKGAEMYKMPMIRKTLVASDYYYLLDDLENYRMVTSKYVNDGLAVVYYNKVALVLREYGSDEKIVILKDRRLYQMFRERFYDLWGKGRVPLRTTAPHTYKDLKFSR